MKIKNGETYQFSWLTNQIKSLAIVASENTRQSIKE